MINRLRLMMKLLLVLLVPALVLSACSGSPSLEGDWQDPGSGLSMHFDANETVTVGLNGAFFSMDYTLEDPNVLIIKGTQDGSIPEIKMTYIVEQDRLTLNLDGEISVFYRVKEK